MTKNLKWRLKDLPSGDDVARLVEHKVITKEEARELLFGNTKDDVNLVDALKKQVEFLEGLVKELSRSRNSVTITPYIRKYEPYWPNQVWCGSSSSTYSTAGSAGSVASISASNYAANLIGAGKLS